ncbi:MAG: adenylosuccinate lyase [Spirochaetaceae bacterium]|nr:MAG: adenylosuccinate lyase [Spirochaetaceae bacterium]
MDERGIFENISPLDHRYYQANQTLFDRLADYLSERAAVRYCLSVEIALLRAHLRAADRLTARLQRQLDRLWQHVSADAVYAEEEITRHNIRALVNVMQRHLPPEVAAWVHVGATSVDILDTAQAMRIRDAMQKVVIPQLTDLVLVLISRAEQEAQTAQVGRTHGRHAVPISFGYALTEYVARLGKSAQELVARSADLRGKLAGAVGAYNALAVVSTDPVGFEHSVLRELGLKPSEYATQLVEPEYQLRLLLEINTAFGIIANLADDLRHLQRSEIDEVRERFGMDQVGSSTMPQKRNPWNCEHVKSLWKAFMPRVQTFYMDQISEHQRDLSNSASSRFVMEFITGFAAAVARMHQVVRDLDVDRDRMLGILQTAGDTVLAEPAYICLALGGRADAHEVVRRATLRSETEKRSITAILRQDPDVWRVIETHLQRVGYHDAAQFFAHPELYRGRAVERTIELCNRYRSIAEQIKEDSGV